MSNTTQNAAAEDSQLLNHAVDSAESLCEELHELKNIVDNVSDDDIEIDEDKYARTLGVANVKGLTHRLDALSLMVKECANALRKSQL